MHTEDLYHLLPKPFSISTDTRSIAPGDIYIGIKGDTFDGNTFAAQALEKGARYAIIDNPQYELDERCILVSNTRKTLEELTTIHRKTFTIPVLVIGGSNGKTTTKELVSAVLSKKYTVHTTKGNLNNDIGVPLTILAMKESVKFAVIEIGANHPGEHLKLLDIAIPTHVLVTNNGADHLEGFGSLEGARSANKEIYDWAKEHGVQVLVFKDLPDLVEDSASLDRILYPKKEYKNNSSIYAGVSYDNIEFSTSLFGAYNEPNILAAIVIGEQFGIPLPDIQQATTEYVPTLKRSQIIKGNGYELILDCYNANPSSMELALKDFFRETTPGKRIVLIGDMFEMGKEEQRVHKEILELVSSLYDTDDIVIVIGPRFYTSKKSFPFVFFEHTESAREYFNSLNLEGKTIFVKASRGMKLEEVLKEKIPLS